MRPTARLACCLALITAAPALRAADGPTTRPAMTDRDLFEPTLAFDRRYFADGYATLGHRDPQWDADAVRLITALVHDGVCDAHPSFGNVPPAMSSADRVALAKRVVDSGCDDAIALYEAASAYAMADDTATATGLFERAEAASVTSKLPPAVQLRIALYNSGIHHHRRLVEATPRLQALVAATLTDPALQAADDRAAVWAFATCAVTYAADNKTLTAFGETIEPLTAVEPWLYHTLMGRVELARAWSVQSSTTPRNAAATHQAFVTHIDSAREHLRQAIAVDDAQPQPYAYLILVGMADQSHTAPGWFDLARSRRFDCTAAYDNYFVSLSPPWGGSIDAVCRAANDAIDTGRFETSVPSMALRAIQVIEASVPAKSLDVTELGEIALRCVDGYLAHPEDSPHARRWARSTRAAWCARLGRWDEAEAQFAGLAAAGESVDESAFELLKLDLADVRKHAAASTQP